MQKIILLICSLLAFSQGHVLQQNFISRIVNGVDVKPGEIPFQVSLQSEGNHFCGGSILNKDYVVTATHCFDGKIAEKISIVAGTINYKKPLQIRKGINITVHEKYNHQQSLHHDVALIKIDSPFEFSKLVQPVPLPELHAKIETNSTAVVSGWGALGAEIERIPDTLKKAQIWIVNQEYCARVMKKVNEVIYPSQICANDPSSRRGQCNGDSGDSLIVDGKLAGIVSWSIKDPYCASTKLPGVYTRVPEHVDWIVNHAI